MRNALAAGLFVLMAGFAQAAPQSINDCEKIADPDAYNRCLAAFGPASSAGKGGTAKATPTTASSPEASVPPAADAPRARSGRGRYAKRGGRGGKSYARSRGRVRMEFSVSSGGSRKSSRGRRRR